MSQLYNISMWYISINELPPTLIHDLPSLLEMFVILILIDSFLPMHRDFSFNTISEVPAAFFKGNSKMLKNVYVFNGCGDNQLIVLAICRTI